MCRFSQVCVQKERELHGALQKALKKLPVTSETNYRSTVVLKQNVFAPGKNFVSVPLLPATVVIASLPQCLSAYRSPDPQHNELTFALVHRLSTKVMNWKQHHHHQRFKQRTGSLPAPRSAPGSPGTLPCLRRGGGLPRACVPAPGQGGDGEGGETRRGTPSRGPQLRASPGWAFRRLPLRRGRETRQGAGEPPLRQRLPRARGPRSDPAGRPARARRRPQGMPGGPGSIPRPAGTGRVPRPAGSGGTGPDPARGSSRRARPRSPALPSPPCSSSSPRAPPQPQT